MSDPLHTVKMCCIYLYQGAFINWGMCMLVLCEENQSKGELSDCPLSSHFCGNHHPELDLAFDKQTSLILK